MKFWKQKFGIAIGISHRIDLLLHANHSWNYRIIWDDQEIVKRIWDRCLLAEGLGKDLERIEKQPGIQGELAADRGVKWKMVRVNERMRFLKYGAGNYFRS